MTGDTNRISNAVAAPAALAVAGLAAYVFELARASAHTAHFGVRFGSADPRSATVPIVAVAILALVVIGTLVMSLRAADVAAPAVVIVVLAGGVTVRTVGGSTVQWVAVFSLLVVTLLIYRAMWRGSRLRRWLAPTMSRVRTALTVPGVAVLVTVSLAVLWGARALGSAEGRLEAATMTDFDVVRRDATTATVIFTRTGDIVERVLDISPGADGKPRNVWLPGVTIRPMPDSGIRYETVRLGATKPSEAVQP